MAIDVKALLTYALLEMIERKPLKKITVTELLSETGVSRRTYYSYFRDKNDLICWIYQKRVLDACVQEDDILFASSAYYEKLQHYRTFVTQSCKIEGQNNLPEYIFLSAREYFKNRSEKNEDSDFYAEYHAAAIAHMCVKWILDGMKIPSAQMASKMEEMLKKT